MKTILLIRHGMAILERFARPRRELHEDYIDNGQCVICACEGETLAITGGAPPC